MTCSSRFTDCDSSPFPAIYEYNYSGNTNTRSSNNRSFTWQDVTKSPVYLYDEVTISGNFENNLFSNLHTIGSGVNYIVNTITGIDTSSYPGWTLSGGYSIWVGMSGVTISSGQLSGFTGSCIIHPIEGDESIALYSDTGSPCIYSDIYYTGEGSVLPLNTHQVYLNAKTVYSLSSGEYIYAFPRGYNAGQIVAMYDNNASEWITTIPTGSKIFIPTGTYTEIKYTFYTDDYPAVTPTGFDLYVGLASQSGIVVIDDIHLDSVLKKNAFIDTVVPSGYMIEITPDIGSHNILDAFDTGNPLLHTVGPFSIPAGNLTDNLDNTVTAEIDESDFLRVINNRFSKYLWRAIALSDDGSYGELGIPRKFTYIGDQINDQFSVTSISNSIDSTTKTIIGNRPQRCSILVNGASHPEITYPTSSTWKLLYTVNYTKETISLQAQDEGGALSSIKYVTLETPEIEQIERALWNTFDEHGLLMDIERLPSESNYKYKERITDVSVSRGGATIEGIVNSASRELNLTKISNGLVINIKAHQNNIPIATQFEIDVGSVYIRARIPSMVKEEILLVDPIYRTITLSKYPAENISYCELYNGKPIDLSNLEYDKLNEEIGTDIRVKINDPEVLGKYVTVRYQYFETVYFSAYPTIGSLVEALNQLVDNVGNLFLDVQMSEKLSGNEASIGLYASSFNPASSETVLIPWSSVSVKSIADRQFREYSKNGDSYRNSKFYGYVKALQNDSHVLWGSVEADRDYWDAADRTDLSFDTIPTLMDPILSKYISNTTGYTDSVQVWARNYIDVSGNQLQSTSLKSEYFHPGVGFKNDLIAGIYYTSTNRFESEEEYLNISSERKDNTEIYFSGQR